MAKKIKKFITEIFSRRAIIVLVIFAAMTAVLTVRLFQLQIVEGQSYAENFTVMTTKERALKSTRGLIYDVNGKVLAYNQLANSVTLEDSGSYPTNRERNLSLNGEIYALSRLIRGNGDSMTDNFHIKIDKGQFVFDVPEGITRNRFRADVFGCSYISEMTPEQASADADDIIDLLSGNERFALYNQDRPYTEDELLSHGLPLALTKQEQLDIIIVRYLLSLTSYKKYVQVTIASNVSDETVAMVEENINEYEGVDIVKDYIRVYNDAEAMASIIGYTGSPSAEELEALQEQRDDYTSDSIIGKAGIEQYMETTLQGYDGTEQVTVDNRGRVLSVNEESLVNPIQGNDVYLTIDSELQTACYKILEQRIAGILVSNIQNVKYSWEAERDPDDEDAVPIPIYDVYNALIKNSVIDIDHFTAEDATPLEKSVYEKFRVKQDEVFSWVSSELTGSLSTPYDQLSDEMKEYEDYIIKDLLIEDTGILDEDNIDTSDDIYISWDRGGSISLKDFLSYAVTANWINVSAFVEDDTYLSSEEVYQALAYTISAQLSEDTWFSKIMYKYLLFSDRLFPDEILRLLYDQHILNTADGDYDALTGGTLSCADFILKKIRSLEIKPKQLALDPCSGSIVITDPDTGDTRALVTYPGYDNNRLANRMDTDYYRELYNDLSTPFYNKATQQTTAPGSTFKPVMVAAGMNEGVIDENTVFECDGLFGEDLVDVGDQLRCWFTDGHGKLNVAGAIQNSCNVYFCTVGYLLGLDDQGQFIQSQTLSRIQQYASMFDLDKKTGLEIAETTSSISDSLAIPSSIGQGTHSFTTAALARYAAALANEGTCYDLTLLDHVSNPDGTVLKEYEPKISNQVTLDNIVWEQIHTGMRNAIIANGLFPDFPVELYAKTGTAQESVNRADHAVFIGHAHYGEEKEDIAFAIRIAYGYSSTNAAMVAKDVLTYYYGLEGADSVITGTSAQEGLTNSVTD